MKKCVLSVIMVLCLLVNGLTISAMEIPATDSADTLNIIHINDVHGYAVETSTAIGYAKIAGFVEAFKSVNPDNTLFVDAGPTIVEGETGIDSKAPTVSQGQTQKTAAVTDNPSTGDDSIAAVYIVLILAAVITIVTVIVVRRKWTGKKK